MLATVCGRRVRRTRLTGDALAKPSYMTEQTPMVQTKVRSSRAEEQGS